MKTQRGLIVVALLLALCLPGMAEADKIGALGRVGEGAESYILHFVLPAGSTISGSTATWASTTDGNDTEINRLATAVKANAASPVSATTGTFATTLSAGATGFQVDADGDVTMKSATVSKVANTASVLTLFNDNGTQTIGFSWKGPHQTTAQSADFVWQVPTGEPAAGQVMAAGSVASNTTTATWVSPAILGNNAFTGTEDFSSATLRLPTGNADPTAAAGWIRHDSTVSNHADGALRWHDGTNIRQVVDMVAATAEGCTGGYVIAYNSSTDLFYCKEDATAGAPTLDTIGDPAAATSIALDNDEGITIESAEDTGTVLLLKNTDADLAGATSILDLSFNDDGQANGYFLRCYDNAYTDLKCSIGADGAATFGAATVTTLNGHTFTTGTSTFTGTAGQTYTFPSATSTLATLGANTFTDDQTITSATPDIVLNDSDDAAGTASIKANSSGGANDIILTIGVEDSSGAGTSYIEVDGVTETVDLLKPVVSSEGITIADTKTLTFDESAANPDDADVVLSGTDGVLKIATANGAFNEDLTIDLDGTENTAVIGTSTGVTKISTGSIAFATTGYIQGAIKIASDADGMDATATAAAGMYGTLFVATGAGTWILPAAAEGMNFCLLSTTAAEIIIDVDASDDITLVGVQDTDGDGVTNASGEAAGDFICMIAIDATHWYVFGKQGTWTAQ